MSVRMRTLQHTCSACPSQWEGETQDGQFLYVRYRWGRLTWGFGTTIDNAIEASVTAQGKCLGDPLDGELSTQAMLEELALIVPSEETEG